MIFQNTFRYAVVESISHQKPLNKSPETMWFKISERCFLIILEASSPNHGVGQDHASSNGSLEESILDYFLILIN